MMNENEERGYLYTWPNKTQINAQHDRVNAQSPGALFGANEIWPRARASISDTRCLISDQWKPIIAGTRPFIVHDYPWIKVVWRAYPIQQTTFVIADNSTMNTSIRTTGSHAASGRRYLLENGNLSDDSRGWGAIGGVCMPIPLQ